MNIIFVVEGGKRAIEMTKALLYFICKQNLPHSIVETEGFRHYSRVATPLYKIPTRKTVSNINVKPNFL